MFNFSAVFTKLCPVFVHFDLIVFSGSSDLQTNFSIDKQTNKDMFLFY